MTKRDVVQSAIAIVLCLGGICLAGDPPPLPEGCQPCLHPLSGGHIDWTNGYVFAEGVGKARGTTKKDRLGAKRAGEVIAVRNALAIAVGIPIDGDNRFGDIQNGEVQLQGIVKGHKIISANWLPNKTPPECQVKIRVPLWGITGVASLVYASQHQKSMRVGRGRLALNSTGQDTSDEILIIDARGSGTTPCMFTRVVTSDNHVLYDICTMTTAKARWPAPPVRYVESTLTFEELRTSAPAPACETSHQFADMGKQPKQAKAGTWTGTRTGTQNGDTEAWMFCVLPDPPKPRHGRPGNVTTTRPGKQAASQPTTQPNKSQRRKRRVVRAIKVPGADKTQVVLAREDAEKLRKDPRTANLLRSGKVVVVVDSVAAGIEGSLPTWPDDSLLASAETR